MTDDATAEYPAPTAPTSSTTTESPAAPGATPGAAAGSAPAPAPQATPPRRHPAQFGTIVWGMLLLALCGFVALTRFGPGVDADRFLWAFVGVIAAGVALVVVGIVAAFRR